MVLGTGVFPTSTTQNLLPFSICVPFCYWWTVGFTTSPYLAISLSKSSLLRCWFSPIAAWTKLTSVPVFRLFAGLNGINPITGILYPLPQGHLKCADVVNGLGSVEFCISPDTFSALSGSFPVGRVESQAAQPITHQSPEG